MIAAPGELDTGPAPRHDRPFSGKEPQTAGCHAARPVKRQRLGGRIALVGSAEGKQCDYDVASWTGKVRLPDDLNRWRSARPSTIDVLTTYRPSVGALRKPISHLGFDPRETSASGGE